MTMDTAKPVTQEDIAEWYKAKNEMAVLATKEMELRKRIFGEFFPAAIEGTNKTSTPLLGADFHLVAQRKVNREVDEDAMKTMLGELRDRGIDPKKLVAHKPALVKSEYNKLTAEQKGFFDRCLIIKDGAPTLEIKAGRLS